jgi:adenosyl cobinamide kinase/adenosyl cobinamide phosphate guanylyltransferase
MGLVLLTGGVRCGKSSLAVRLAAESGREVVFIATALDTETDPDMGARIQAHRDQRPGSWRTIEEPVAVAEQVAVAPEGCCVVVDCLGLWVANLMSAGLDEPGVVEQARLLAGALAARPLAIAVTNEVGMGVHPQTPAGRAFRDLLGRVNTVVAEAAGDAYLVVAGRLLPLLHTAQVAGGGA